MLPPELFTRLCGSAALMSGRMHILNLDRLEPHFGDRWPKVKERALAVVEQTLRAGLGPHDLHSKAGDASWVMFFPSLEKAAAQTLCAMLAHRVYRHLIGDDVALDELKITTVVAEVDGRMVMESADPLALLKAALDAAALDEAALGGAAPFEAKEGRAALFEARGLEPPPQREQRWIAVPPELFPPDIRFHFVPMLDVDRGVINTYQCEPWRDAPGGITLTGHGVLQTGERSPLVGELDCRRLATALAAVRSLRQRGEAAVIALPVHCRTVEMAEARLALLKILEGIRPEEKRFLALGISGLPDGAPTARINYIAHFLQRFCQAVTIMRPIRQPLPERLEGAGLFGMSVNLLNAQQADSAGAALDGFVRSAKSRGLKALAFGLATPVLVGRAMTGGFSHVSGDGLLPPQQAPEGIRRFSCDLFLRRLDAQRVLRTADSPARVGLG